MENDEKLQKVNNDASDDVQNKTELIEKEEKKEVLEEPTSTQVEFPEEEVTPDEGSATIEAPVEEKGVPRRLHQHKLKSRKKRSP